MTVHSDEYVRALDDRRAIDDLRASMPVTQHAAGAVETRRRKRIARVVQAGLAVAAAATIIGMVALRTRPEPPRAVRTVVRTFELHCISPDRVVDVLPPMVRQSSRMSFHPSQGLIALQVEAAREQMDDVQRTIEKYDNPATSTCTVK